jgi:hypothetical protein
MEPDAWKAESPFRWSRNPPIWLAPKVITAAPRLLLYKDRYVHSSSVPHLFQIHSNITFSSKWSQLFWHFDKNCLGIFHFSQCLDYLLKVTRKDIINLIYIPFFYETFVLCVLDSSYCDARPHTHTHTHTHTHIYIYIYLETRSLPLHISIFSTCDLSLQTVELT